MVVAWAYPLERVMEGFFEIVLAIIYQGLLLAKHLGILELVCYSDSLLCVNLLKDPTLRFHVYAFLIQDVKDLMEQSNIIVCHTLREGNQCAYFLAKLENKFSNLISIF
jgi:hypothetical protein